jgi:hypothetical protein
MQHQDITTRPVDLLSGCNYNNFYIISHYQILFKKIKSPKIKSPSLSFLAPKKWWKVKFLTLTFFKNYNTKWRCTHSIFHLKYSGRQATREGAVGKGACWESALFPSAPSPSLPTTILHVNSSYAHHCFFTKRRLLSRSFQLKSLQVEAPSGRFPKKFQL